MAETTLLEKTEELVAKAQDDALDAGRRLAEGIAKEASRLTPPVAHDVVSMVDQVFDFAERITNMQRTMVNEVLTAVSKSTVGRSEEAPTK